MCKGECPCFSFDEYFFTIFSHKVLTNSMELEYNEIAYIFCERAKEYRVFIQ